MSDDSHISVLLEESVESLITDVNGIYIDGTFGRGGHSRKILSGLSGEGRLIGFDKDPQAIDSAKILQGEDTRFSIEYSSFSDMGEVSKRSGQWGQVDGILLDLGVSSPQLDQADRGFSFLKDGPLDMRMNSQAGESAAQWVNRSSEVEMVKVFRDYGEERFAKRIARAIIAERVENPFTRTSHLAAVVAEANPKWEREKNPATRVFQAIRIEVNQELTDLEKFLKQSLDILKPGGRLVIISFHSLEDRLVKRFFKREEMGTQYPKGLPITQDMINSNLRIVCKRVKAGPDELERNPRARSAVMRVAEKLEPGRKK